MPHTVPQWLAAISVLLANVNIFGGFVITKRMLDMFKRATDAPEYLYLYAVPGVAFSAAFLAAATTGASGLVQAGYLASSILCISEYPLVTLLAHILTQVGRLHFRSCFPDYGTSWERARYFGSRIWCHSIPSSRRVLTRSSCPIRHSHNGRRLCRCLDRSSCNRHGTPSNSRSPSFRRRSCCRIHLHR